MIKIIKTKDKDKCTIIALNIFNTKLVAYKRYPNGAAFLGFYKNNLRNGYGIKRHKDFTFHLVKYKKGIKLL